jgi:hypothetical protein
MDALDDLLARYGTTRRPAAHPTRPRPVAVTDETVAALGKLSEALEVVEDARGHLYAFHRLSGQADLTLQDAVRQLHAAGHHEVADRVDEVLVGRDVAAGRWTFQLVEEYDRGYWSVFHDVERVVRHRLLSGVPHLYEAEMKDDEQTRDRVPDA